VNVCTRVHAPGESHVRRACSLMPGQDGVAGCQADGEPAQVAETWVRDDTAATALLWMKRIIRRAHATREDLLAHSAFAKGAIASTLSTLPGWFGCGLRLLPAQHLCGLLPFTPFSTPVMRYDSSGGGSEMWPREVPALHFPRLLLPDHTGRNAPRPHTGALGPGTRGSRRVGSWGKGWAGSTCTRRRCRPGSML